MALDLSSLIKAIDSLEKAINISTSKDFMDQLNDDKKNVIKSGVIQNFEFTYELCWKFIKRWLEENDERKNIDGLTMKELFRIAAERQLINDVEAWFEYHKKRNKTAHTYDIETAEDVYKTSVHFIKDAKALLKVLESKND